MSGKHDVVQVKNPRTNKYVKIDRTEGKIVSHKKTSGPYKGVPVARRKK
jgi:glutamate dehydrogenase/leucine dehydrogenase